MSDREKSAINAHTNKNKNIKVFSFCKRELWVDSARLAKCLFLSAKKADWVVL